MDSPAVLKVQQLTQKLHASERELNDKKMRSLMATERRVGSLSSQLAGMAPSSSDVASEVSFTVLREQIQKLYENIAGQRLALELMEERKAKELQIVENALALDIVLARSRTLEQANAFVLSLNQTARELRSEMQETRLAAADAETEQSRQSRGELDRVARAVDDERRAREAGEQHLQHSFAAELEDIRGLLAHEQRERQESEQSLMRMLEDMTQRCHQRIEAERAERESMQDALLSVLEQALTRR